MARILLVDDEELVVKSIEKLLKKEGHEVVSVKNGQDALNQAETIDFDLIITDIRMPKLNGLDTIQRLREYLKAHGKSRIPEICITGYADNDLNHRAEELGINEYLYKPFDLRDFLACVKRCLA